MSADSNPSPKSYHRRVWASVAALALVATTTALTAPVTSAGAAGGEPIVAVNFQSSGARVPAGFVRDFGQPFDEARGYGWVDADGSPISLVGNGRDRGATDDQRLDTLVTAPADASFEYVVDPGQYDVTVTVGDSAPDGVGPQSIGLEGIAVFDSFIPTSSQPHRTETRMVDVIDGRLTVGSLGDRLSINSIEVTQVSRAQASADPNCADADATVGQFNFSSQSAAVPSGYVRDHGRSYSLARGYGWQTEGAGTPLSLVGNGRDRDMVSDQRTDTFLQMQYRGADGVTTDGQWAMHLELEGYYEVTVGVGDADVINSRHTIRLEGKMAIRNFSPTPQRKFRTATVCVEVTDQELTIDAIGGDNTKIDYVEVRSATPMFEDIKSLPADGATGVFACSGVTLVTTRGLDATTLDSSTMRLAPTGDPDAVVPGVYNSDAAGGVAGFQPQNPSDPDQPALAPSTAYTLTTTAGLTDKNGVSFAPYTLEFTTSSAPLSSCSDVSFDRVVFDDDPGLIGPTSIVLGPDGKLYVSTSSGQIRRYTLDSSGLAVGSPTTWFPFGAPAFDGGGNPTSGRIIIGMSFEPGSTPGALRMWVTNNQLGFGNGVANWSGAVTLLTGSTSTNLMPVAGSGITGLPRSVKDHMTNSLEFGPPSACESSPYTGCMLFFNQGSQSGYGSPDNGWQNRPETPLSAAVVRADVLHDPTFTDGSPVDVQTGDGGTYNPATGPVKAHADGVRNAYDLTFTPDDRLFVGVNEAANGDVPAGSKDGATWGEYVGVGSGNDFVSEIVQGKYYGHPNPSLSPPKIVLNGGNPTAGVDPWEFSGFPITTPPGSCSGNCSTGYPVGVQPHTEWKAPLKDLGPHRSPNGIDVYESEIFGPLLQNKLIMAEYSQGDRIVAVDPDSGDVLELARGFFNPLDARVVGDEATSLPTGLIYVAEFGKDSTDADSGFGGRITLLSPSPDVSFETIGRFNFTAEPGTVVSGYTVPEVDGYTADWGLAYPSTDTADPHDFGWVTVGTQTPRNMNGEGRYRTGAFDDERNPLQASFMHMDRRTGGGTPTGPGPADWQIEVANGDYDVTVSTGDATNFNETHLVRVEGTVAIGPYTPSAPKDFQVATVRVTVGDGRLTLNQSGGSNTKINYVEIVKVTES